MKFDEIKEKLESVEHSSQYVRVSVNHPLELYLGKNEKGYLTLRYNGDFTPIKVIGTNLIEIKQVKTSNYNSILFSFISEENITLFYHFCEDIITETESYQGNEGYKEIINRYNQWKKMFTGSNKVLTENEVLGLLGELLFLKDVAIPTYGTTDGLNSWSGPEPTHKDFSYKNDWYEIKSINTFKNSVSISSLEQLDSELEGHLVVYSFEKMSPSFSGISLNRIVSEIIRDLSFDTDKDIFLNKLKQVGYSYNELYDNYVFNLIKKESYLVNDDFPRIKLDDLKKGITKVQYEVLLSLIEKNKEN